MVRAVMIPRRKGKPPADVVDGMKVFESWVDRLVQSPPPPPVLSGIKRKGK